MKWRFVRRWAVFGHLGWRASAVAGFGGCQSLLAVCRMVGNKNRHLAESFWTDLSLFELWRGLRQLEVRKGLRHTPIYQRLAHCRPTWRQSRETYRMVCHRIHAAYPLRCRRSQSQWSWPYQFEGCRSHSLASCRGDWCYVSACRRALTRFVPWSGLPLTQWRLRCWWPRAVGLSASAISGSVLEPYLYLRLSNYFRQV